VIGIPRKILGGVVLLGALTLVPALAAAQTSDEECLADKLRLVSPDRDGLRVSLQVEPPFGAIVRWADLDDSQTTCAVVSGADSLGFDIALDGFYNDVVDRQLNFFAPAGGAVGSAVKNRVTMQWNNANLAFTGTIVGEINLSNNGGLLIYDAAADSWRQENAGLPMFLNYTDLVAYAASPLDGGRRLCALEDRLSRGLWYKADASTDWVRVREDLFPDVASTETRITAVAFSPVDANTYVVGTSNRGVFLTRNGGVDFTQIQDIFVTAAPGADPADGWSQRRVTTFSWTAADRLYVAINQLGLYVSTDGLDSVDLLETLLVPTSTGDTVPPVVRCIVDAGAGRLLVGVQNYGVYESRNGGEDWSWRWTQILNQPTFVDVRSLTVSPADPNEMVATTSNLGIFHTSDGGLDWDQVYPAGSTYPDEPPLSGDFVPAAVWSQALGMYVAMVDGEALLTSSDGMTWLEGGLALPSNLQVKFLQSVAVGDDALALASYNGGIYVPGSALSLTSTMRRASTDAAYRDLDFGLDISFSEGVVDSLTSFRLKLQDFQGYGVWRSETGSPDDMELIGLYDKNNPETCIQGYCGGTGYYQLPNCYVDKRAACFDFSDPDTVKFFDDNVYDGFQYFYAVTTFDYGNTALASPSSLASDQVFSARFDGDPNAPFGGDGNRVRFNVNQAAQPERGGDEIYVFPNPLRNTSRGFSQSEDGVEVNFVNLPPSSRVKVFTVDGDLVGDLGGEGVQEGHSIKWITRNDDGELLASGVYIYKVEMPSRDDYFGKLVIIR